MPADIAGATADATGTGGAIGGTALATIGAGVAVDVVAAVAGAGGDG
ncbi:MAG TPA: hypothetical protein VLY23_18865 [Candidatus Acidoferrum sp.]|nr:hypothetical protein [Candidatus Acidoferrum sp.]